MCAINCCENLRAIDEGPRCGAKLVSSRGGYQEQPFLKAADIL